MAVPLLGAGGGAREGPRLRLAVAFTVGSRLLGKVVGVAFVVVMARLATQEDFAGYSYLVVLVLVAALITDTGVGSATGRGLRQSGGYVADAYGLGLPTAAVSGAAAAGLVGVIGMVDSAPGSAGGALVCACCYVAINAVGNFQGDVLRFAGRVRSEAVVGTVTALTFPAAGALILFRGGGLGEVMAAFAAREALRVGGYQLLLPAPRLAGLAESWRMARSSLAIGVAGTLLALSTRVPAIAIGNAGSVAEVAAFGIASRVWDLIMLLFQSAGLGFGPVLVGAYTSGHGHGRRMGRKLAGVLAGVGLCVGGLIAFIAPLAVPWLMGEEYRDSVAAVQCLALSAPAIGVLYASWYWIIGEGRDKALVRGTGWGVAVAGAGVGAIALEPTAVVAGLVTVGVCTAIAVGLLREVASEGWLARRVRVRF